MDSLTVTPLDGRSVEETLVVEALWLESLEGNCEIFLAAAHYADLCNGDALPDRGTGSVLPGTERSVQLGGEGTPRVAEFAAAAFGARLRMGTVGGTTMIADALDARHRLPQMYARVRAREARVPWVRHVARKTRELSLEAARRVDEAMAESVDGRVPWSRFCAALEGQIVAADPEAAARREEDRRREVFAKSTRFSEHGTKGFYLRGPVALVVRFDATVAFMAEALKALGDTDDEDQRRVKACLVLANPMQAVELLAAFAAHRARTGASDDVPLPEDETTPEDANHDDSDPQPSALVPRAFRPTELPAWLARACDPTTSLGTALLDWPRLLPRVNVFLHLAEETVRAAREGTPDGVVRWEGEGPVTLRTSASSSRRTTRSRSPRSSTSPVRHRWMPMRSPRDVGGPCVCARRPTASRSLRTWTPWTSTTPRSTSTRPGSRKRGLASRGWATTVRSAGSTTGSRRTGGGGWHSRSTGSTSGATRTGTTTWSTTPARARSPLLRTDGATRSRRSRRRASPS